MPTASAPLRHWLQAARPLAQANIALPLLVGQAIAYATCGQFSWLRCALIFLFGVLDQLFIVFANDVADWEGDRLNKTYNAYSGGSRVIPEGKIAPQSLAFAALGAVGLMAMLSAYMTLKLGLMWMLLLCSLAVLLLWAYSFGPIRLSYRGRGELLQGLGTGVVLPAIGFYVQCGELSAFPVALFWPLFLLGYAGNLTTALPDVPADRAANKRSYAVRRGQRAARRDSLLAIAVAAALGAFLLRELPMTVRILCAAVPLVLLALNVPGVPSADAQDRRACFRFVTVNGAAISAAQLAWIVALFTSR